MPRRLVSKTFEMTTATHDVIVRTLNARQFKTFVIDSQAFAKAQGGDVFDKLVELLSTVIVSFKDEYMDENDSPLTTTQDILWALDMNELNDMCTDIIDAVKLGKAESKNLNSSQDQPTAALAGNVEIAVNKEKEPASNIQEKTAQL